MQSSSGKRKREGDVTEKQNKKLKDNETPSGPQVLSGFQYHGLKSSEIPESLPPLPRILNKTLETAVFTHQGATSGKATALNYEKLEWVGDTYIEHTVTILISQTFYSLTTGQCSQLREKFVKNATLADFATKYGFQDRANLPDYITHEGVHNGAKACSKVKILGDIFEAYVAAIVLSDPGNGLATVNKWLKDLLGMVLRKDVIQEEGKRLDQEDNLLWNLGWSIDKNNRDPKVVRNPKENLAFAVGGTGVKIEYKDEAAPYKGKDNLMVFTVGVYLTGWGVKDKMLGIGKGVGKKEAGNRAAQAALDSPNKMQVYQDKKRLRDEQIKREKEMLEQQGASI